MGNVSGDGWVDVVSADGTTLTDLGSIDKPYLYGLSVADDGTSMMIANFGGTIRYTVPGAPGDPITGIAAYGGSYVNSVAISPDGTYVATGSDYDHEYRTFGPSSSLLLRTYAPASADVVPAQSATWLGSVLVTVTLEGGVPLARLHGDATKLPTTLTVSTPAEGR